MVILQNKSQSAYGGSLKNREDLNGFELSYARLRTTL